MGLIPKSADVYLQVVLAWRDWSSPASYLKAYCIGHPLGSVAVDPLLLVVCFCDCVGHHPLPLYCHGVLGLLQSLSLLGTKFYDTSGIVWQWMITHKWYKRIEISSFFCFFLFFCFWIVICSLPSFYEASRLKLISLLIFVFLQMLIHSRSLWIRSDEKDPFTKKKQW